MDNFYSQIIETLRKKGIYKIPISKLLNQEQLQFFYQTQKLYEEVLEFPQVVKKIDSINKGVKWKRKKHFELGSKEYFGRGLDITDGGLVKLYLQEPFIKIAELFHNTLPKVRNVLMWAHPYSPSNTSPSSSQNWHRDQEDYRILKVFINFSKIDINNGPTQFIPETHHDGNLGGMFPQPHYQGMKKYSFNIKDELQSQIVDITGDVGTVSFIDTNGLHRGGLVKSGIRLLTQATYLNPNAPLIKEKTLETYTSNGVNIIDYSSEEFNTLNTKQQYLLT